MIRGNDRGMTAGVGRVDSRFHGNDGGGEDGHSCSTGGVRRVDSRFHGNDGGGSPGGVGRVDSCSLVGVRRVDSRGMTDDTRA